MTSDRDVGAYLAFGDIFRAHRGYLSDKWMQYLAVYERELRPLVADGMPLRLLEIGIQNGGSLEVWHKYLPAGSQITGIDIDPRCGRIPFPRGVKVLTGDAGDPVVLQNLLGDELFDIIIDDGSHLQQHIINAFTALIPRLVPGGKYFVEDMHTSYWVEFGGGLRDRNNAVEFLKDLIDDLHIDHHRLPVGERSRQAIDDANSQICQLSFYDSIAVIEKYRTPKTSRFPRVLAGNETHVVSVGEFAAAVLADPDGFELPQASARPIIEAALLSVRQEAAERSSELEAVRAELAQYRIDAEVRDGRYRDALTQAEALQSRVTELETMLHTRDNEIAEARSEAASGAASLQTALDDLAVLLATQSQLTAVLGEARSELETVRSALSESAAAHRALRASAAQHEATLAALRGEIEAARQRQGQAIDGLEREIAELRDRLVEAQAQAADRAAAVTTAEDQLATLNRALNAARDVGRAALQAMATESPAVPSVKPSRWRLSWRRRSAAY